jgi:hypothetical protein
MRVTFFELSAFWKKAAAEVPIRGQIVLEELMASGTAMSREMIGHERPEWPPLAAKTIAEKTRHGFVGRVSATDPLLETGEMRDSIGFEAIWPQGAFGATDPKSVDHEFGTARIPPRPFIRPVAEEIAVVLAERLAKIGIGLVVPSTEDVL